MTEAIPIFWRGAVLFCAVVLASSCTRIGNYAEKRADIAGYDNIHASQYAAFGGVEPFRIDESDEDELRALLEKDLNAAEPELFTLSDVLAIAIANSRSYQTRKESLFIEALNLTEVQKDFSAAYLNLGKCYEFLGQEGAAVAAQP